MRYRALAMGYIVVACMLGACARDQVVVELEGGGDSRDGPELIESYGCGSCHRIPGVRGADATAAPPLDDFARRAFIAGRIENSPDNLVRWIIDPQSVDPRTAMPDLSVTEEDARDIAAFLETLGR